MTDAAPLRAAIAALESQRAVLGDEVTELALAPLRQLLAQAEAAAPQLRRAQVTVLFADIVESTALAARLDAEDVLQVFGRMLERAAACVRARGGRVLRYTGDGLKAGFGTQGTREDDAAQAVQAGLDILAAGREHAAWVAREHGVEGFALRVGAHTGEVALGAGFEADNTLTGDTVNIAARMEQAAPPGALRISAETWSHVRGLFDAEAQPPLQAKGIDTPLQTFLVHRLRQGAVRRGARGIEGVPTRMIGREAELGLLQAAFTRLTEEPRFAAVTVVADAGVGKSRLLDEFEAWRLGRAERSLVLRGRTAPQTEGQIFGLLRDILARHFEIADDDSLEAARGKVERAIVPLFIDDDGADLAEGHAHLLGHLIGIEWRDSRHIRHILDNARQLRSRALHAAVQLFARLARRDGCPLVLAVEDLHWADTESLDFLDQLAAASQDVPLLLLAFTRPTLYERRSAWGPGAHRRVDLAPLDAAGRDALAAELLQKLPEVPAALSGLLARHAEGNPFYMEELVKMLIDRGAIQTGDPWRVDLDRLQLTRLPGTLTGVLQARLDGLPAPEKRALQQASVVGTVFWAQVLAAIDARATEQLPALARRALALPRSEGAVDGLNEYAFHHQLLQQVTYGTVLKQDRREGHAKVALWMATLAAQGSLRAGDFLGTAAEHFELAGDTAHAAEFHTRAAEHAAQRFAHERVLHHVARALELLGEPRPDQAHTRWRLLTARENTLMLLARRDEQARDAEMLVQLADTLDDDRRRARAAFLHALWGMRVGNWAATEASARRSLAIATRIGDDAQRLHAVRILAAARVLQADVAGGQALAEQALPEVRRLGLRDVEARLYNVLGIVAERQGRVVDQLDMTRRFLALSRDLGDRFNEAIASTNLGLVLNRFGDHDESGQALERALALLDALGERYVQGGVNCGLAIIAFSRGQTERGLASARRALAIAEQSATAVEREDALAILGHLEVQMGRMAAARQAFEALHASKRARGAPVFDALANHAALALAQGDVAGARTSLQPVFDHLAAGGNLQGCVEPNFVEWYCYDTLAHEGDPQAFAWLARMHAALLVQADSIADARLRQCFLGNVPSHRKIVAAWAATQAAPPAPRAS